MWTRRWREKSCISSCRKGLEEVRTGEKLGLSGKTSNNISPEHGHNLEQRGAFNTLHSDEPSLKNIHQAFAPRQHTHAEPDLSLVTSFSLKNTPQLELQLLKPGWRITGRTSTNSGTQFKAFFPRSRKFQLTLFSMFHCSISLCMPALWLGPGPGGASYYKRLFLCYSWFDLKQNVLEILEEHLFPSNIQPKPPRPTSSG